MQLQKSQLKEQQNDAIDFIYGQDSSLVVAQMGFGKTIVALTAIEEMLHGGHVNKVLVLTTKKIAQTVWVSEAAKWSHTQRLNVAVALGSEKERLAALESDVDVVVGTFDNIAWICSQHCFSDFDGLVVDETTKLSKTGGVHFRALRKHLDKFNWRVGFTGTPVAENFQSLFGQMILICGKESPLGTNKEKFMQKFFIQTDYQGYQFELREGADRQILELISDYLYVAEDYTASLPKKHHKTLSYEMSDEVAEAHDKLSKDFVIEDIEAANAAVAVNKLRQIACGFIYDGSDVMDIDSAERLSVLVRCLNRLKKQGRNAVVFYDFEASREGIAEVLTRGGFVFSELDKKNPDKTCKLWNDGGLEVLLLHPKSAGHGLNLAGGGCDVVWFNPIWSNDSTEQANARVWRRGQTNEVTIHTIAARDSVDELVMRRVEDKQGFMHLLNGYAENRRLKKRLVGV